LKTRLTKRVPNRVSLPKVFKQNGYETISLGKVYHHYNDDHHAWTQKPDYVLKPTWKYVTEESYRLIELNRQIDPDAHHHAAPTEMADVPDNAYGDGKLTDRALQEINRFKDKPFFLAVGYRKPHLPFAAPKKYWDMYDPQKIKLAPNPYVPKGTNKYTMTNFGELRKYYGMPKGDNPVSDEQARHLIHGYYACVSFIDAQVGRLLDELKRLKLADKTIVLLWGDHGWKLGEHASWCKHTNFENDTNAPVIISVPAMETSRLQSISTFLCNGLLDADRVLPLYRMERAGQWENTGKRVVRSRA
jgi:arylsulfatase A-like enzyme